jgi:hypothetical protein
MQDNKVAFPGNRISGAFFTGSALLLGVIFVLSIVVLFEGWSIHEVALEWWRLRFAIIALVTVATLSFHHRAIFMRKANENKIHFWKQFTPFFIYTKREFYVEDLSANTRTSTSTSDNGSRTTSYTTHVYQGEKQIFVFAGTRDDLCDLVPGLIRNSKEKSTVATDNPTDGDKSIKNSESKKWWN